jgi:signal peptidase II
MQLLIAIPAIIVLVITDQMIKLWAMSWLSRYDTVPIIAGVIHLTYVENRGAAFGIFQNQRWIFISISIIVCIIGLYYLFQKKTKMNLESWAIILIIAGGIGNLIDRIFRGYVVDYIHFKLIDFAVFNLADSCVCVGATLFCIYFLFLTPKKINETSKDVSEDGNTIENSNKD